MAETSISEEQFICPLCLDLLNDPVTIPCGHSYCMSCITDCWDQEDQKRVYSCPQCRQTFRQTDKHHAGPGDVECDICTGRKHKAVKSCLVCLESYCQTHFERHEEFHSGKRHKVTDATGRLQQMICHQHDKLLEVFCHIDQLYICMLCDRERDLEQLREAVESHKRSAQTAVEDSERIFTELIRSIERSRSEVTQRIRDQEKTAVSRAEGQMERLEQEIEDLKKRNSELEQLSHTDDNIHFLQSLQSLSAPPEATENISVSVLFSFAAVRESVGQLRHKLEDFCKEEMKKISVFISDIFTDTLSNIVPRTREDFLQYSHQFTLDPNTAHKRLRLSEGNRAVTYTDTLQPYPDHPDRFDSYRQVLCRESVSGRCYWELEWSGSNVDISVSYKSISRKRSVYECVFGCNDQSWSLFCSPSSFSFWHNNKQTELPVSSSCRRIGVYVDHSAGTLCFYSVSDTMNLIHTVQTTFTQPLCPGFYVWGHQSSAKLL
uniref:Tripartite motif-containing protein 16-like n=1 Tax=Sinocyclocheilus grahami TaxID=75366 RepID=A0A672KVB1_SINGR